jgi:hypothetical protein
MEIPDTIEFQADGRRSIHTTRVTTLENLAKAIAALSEAIEYRSENKPSETRPYNNLEIEELHKQKAALVELQKRTSQVESSASTSVIEALFPEVPVKKKTAAEKAEIEEWLAIRKKEALKIDAETAEVEWCYGETLDPYGAMEEWELPQSCIGREYFARAPGSDIWVWFGDLPDETRGKLCKRHSRKLAFPAGLEGLPGTSEDAGSNDDDDISF